jgi:hypothetical protein
MRVFCFLGSLVVGLGLGGTAEGAQPGCRNWRWPSSPVQPPVMCCPDDYCAKKLPPAPCPVACRGPDDYCRKALPTVCASKWCGVDDYCPKACPILLAPCYPPWYTCGPADVCGQPEPGRSKANP